MCMIYHSIVCLLFQAEDGIRDLVRSRGLGDVYKRQEHTESTEKESRSLLFLVFSVTSVFSVVNAIDNDLSLIHI